MDNTIVPGRTDQIDGMMSVVIPTYNEAENVEMMVTEITNDLSTHSIAHEIIVVDDDSPDLTWKKAEELLPSHPQLRVIRREGERGLGGAAVRGWQQARGEYLGLIDGDGQHPPQNMSRLYRALTAAPADSAPAPDIAIASRYAEGSTIPEGWSRARQYTALAALWCGRIVLPGALNGVTDFTSGCFVMRRKTITDIPLRAKGFKILLEILCMGRISSITEVGYTFRTRDQGQSKLGSKEAARYLAQVLRLKRQRRAAKSPRYK